MCLQANCPTVAATPVRRDGITPRSRIGSLDPWKTLGGGKLHPLGKTHLIERTCHRILPIWSFHTFQRLRAIFFFLLACFFIVSYLLFFNNTHSFGETQAAAENKQLFILQPWYHKRSVSRKLLRQAADGIHHGHLPLNHWFLPPWFIQCPTACSRTWAPPSTGCCKLPPLLLVLLLCVQISCPSRRIPLPALFRTCWRSTSLRVVGSPALREPFCPTSRPAGWN